MTTQTRTIRYFGYGAMRDLEMMEAVIGRKPKGIPAEIAGFELIVQRLNDIPASVSEGLRRGWGPDYRAYRLRPTDSSDSFVKGTMWAITEAELKIIENWEGNGPWAQTVEGEVEAGPLLLSVISDGVSKDSTGEVVDGLIYEPFLNNREKMIAVAKAEREDFLRENRPQGER